MFSQGKLFIFAGIMIFLMVVDYSGQKISILDKYKDVREMDMLLVRTK
jgi:hypothetical protein